MTNIVSSSASKTSTQEGEWTTVTKHSKKRGGRLQKTRQSRKKPLPPLASTPTLPPPASEAPQVWQELEKSLSHCRLELEHTDFWAHLQEAIQGLPPWQSPLSAIVCYGIGNFSQPQSSPSAPLWQLAGLLSLPDLIRDKSDTKHVIQLHCYDPCLTKGEQEFLQSQSILVIANNEHGQRAINQDSSSTPETTLFYMPHCPLSLYTNVLHTNWDPALLQHIVVLGNSLSAYAHRLLNVNSHVRLLQALEPQWHEKSIPISPRDIKEREGQFEQAFNDTSVTHFPSVSKSAEPFQFPDRPHLEVAQDEML